MKYDLKVCYEDPIGKFSICGDPGLVLRFAIRRAMDAELDAVNQYESMAVVARLAGYDSLAKLFEDIASEEKVHFGEFFRALTDVSPVDRARFEDGIKEASEKIGRL